MKSKNYPWSTWIVAAVLAAGLPTTAQAQGTIEGRVTDASTGQPITQARVVVLGTSLVTMTSAEGRYVLPAVPAGQASVRVTAIGYGGVTRTVTVESGARVALDLALTLQPFSLDEIVVTATGDQAKKELGHQVATIRADSLVLQGAPATGLDQLLSNKAPGVQVQYGNITGTEARVRIRGTSSLSLSNEPIYYIDGIRMESSNGSSSIGIGGSIPSRINDINPEEIESIDIVRGPSAATLYGTDAANGVIVIRTKRGMPGPPKWTVYSELGVLNDRNTWPVAYRGWRTGSTSTTNSTPANAVQCILTQVARGQCVQDSVSRFNLFEDPEASPLGTGWRGQAGAQVAGGTEAARYFVAAEYEEELGVLRMPQFAYGRVTQSRGVAEVPYEQYRPNERQRASVRANVQAALNRKIDVAAFTSFISSNQRLPQTDNNTTGLLSNGYGGPGHKNNVAASGDQLYGYRAFTPDGFFSETVRQDINRFIGSGTVNYRPNSWLSSRVVVGVDFTSRVDEDLCRRDECVAFSDFKEGFKEENRTTFHDYTFDGNLTASYTLPALRGAQARTTGGVQYFKNIFARNGAFGAHFAPGSSTITPAEILDADETFTGTKTLGAFIEQVFSWNDRLYITGAFRMDDNSAFGKDYSAVYYPKISASWVLSQEPFFPVMGWLSNLRLRGAYGASGRQPNSTDALTFFSPTTTKFENTDRPAIIYAALGDKTLQPERATELEMGFDAAFAHSRVNVEFTYYNKVTKQALIERPIPPSVGVDPARFENLGSMRNRGVEVAVTALLANTDRFAWDMTLSGSHNANEIVELGVPPIVGTTIQQRQGYPVDSYWQRPILGYNDVNGDGILEAHELVVGDSVAFFGPNVAPDQVMLTTGLNFFNRRLRISGLVDYKHGGYQLNGTERIRCESRLNCDGLVDPTAPLWKQARVVALREHSSRTQAGFIEPVDVLRFRELALNYTLPDSWGRIFRAERIIVTLAGRNLWRTTGYSGLDPESGYFAGGVQTDFQTQPPPTYWTLRFSANF